MVANRPPTNLQAVTSRDRSAGGVIGCRKGRTAITPTCCEETRGPASGPASVGGCVGFGFGNPKPF
jgi:hypothetical protein